MQNIEFFTKETVTSSFILDVLSSVNYTVNVHENLDNLNENFTGSIIIWDLDSFEHNNISGLETVRKIFPESLILIYAKDISAFANICDKLYDTKLSAESIKVHLMTRIAKLKEISSARKIFKEHMSHLIGHSSSMCELRKIVERAMLQSGPVLIQGETGVGKELFAKAVACIYDKFVTINCSAIPDNLFESELFGHMRGAFTGAVSDRVGLFEEANGGAIFLDEIGDMPMFAQTKLLRVLQNNEIRPLGSNKIIHINVRIIAATNCDLLQKIYAKQFREDLFYRLNVIPMQITPLRARKEDISELVDYFIRKYQEPGEQHTISKAALKKLFEYDWPGNIRELENVIRRALCFATTPVLEPEIMQITKYDIPKVQIETQTNYKQFRNSQLNDELNFLKHIINENNGSVRNAAISLGMQRTALYNRLNHLNATLSENKNI